MRAPLTLTRRGIGWLVAAAALMLGWFFIGLRDIWYLAAFLAALVVVSCLAAVVMSAALRARITLSVSDPTPVAGEDVTITCRVRHRLPLPVTARVALRAGLDAYDIQQTLTPAGAAQTDIDAVLRQRGEHTVEVTSITVTDPLGVANARARGRETRQVLVLPRTNSLLADRLATEPTASAPTESVHLRSAGRDSGAPGGAVRQYRSGDPLHRIHWKQSARQGEMLVNLPEDAQGVRATVVLVTDPDAYPSDDQFEAAVSATATLTREWLRQGRPVRIRTSGGGDDLCEGEAEASRLLARIQPEPAGFPEGHTDPAAWAPDALVTGVLTPATAGQLAAAPAGGLLLTAAPVAAETSPAAWHVITIPDEHE